MILIHIGSNYTIQHLIRCTYLKSAYINPWIPRRLISHRPFEKQLGIHCITLHVLSANTQKLISNHHRRSRAQCLNKNYNFNPLVTLFDYDYTLSIKVIMSEDEQRTYVFERQLAPSLRHRSPIGQNVGKINSLNCLPLRL